MKTLFQDFEIPGVIQALNDGESIRVFLSGGGLRVAYTEGKKTGYGEHPFLSGALEHLSESYLAGGFTYEEMYYGENARHPHYLTGSPRPENDLDAHVRRGAKIFFSKKGEDFLTTLPQWLHRDLPKEIIDRARADKKTLQVSFKGGFKFKITPGEEGYLTTSNLEKPEKEDPYYVTFEAKGCAQTLRESVLQALSQEFQQWTMDDVLEIREI